MLIDVKNLFKIYHEGEESEVRALDGVSLSVDRGEFLAIIGQSGSGKSTLMNILGCLDIPTYGDYHLDGVDVTELSDRQLAHIRNKQIGFIFQGFNLIPALNAWENVELPLIYQGVPASKRADRVEAALERVGLAERAGHKPTEMSGGQQQRVAIARAIATQPPSSWPTSPPAPWTPAPASTCWRSSTACTTTAPPSSSSPTTTASPPPPSASCASPTGISSTTATERGPFCEPDPSLQDRG